MEDKKYLISVIVPIYNVESYLCKCIDSILSQTYKNLEIILVDDGSPDNCPKLCDDYAKKDKRIKVIHKKNGGLSDARNAGLEVATGHYIGFVDSDDFIDPTMYEKLLDNAIDKESDISMCEDNFVFENGDVIYNNEINLEKINGTNFSSYAILFENKKKENLILTESVSCGVCRCLYKKSFIGNNRFVKGMWYEDFIFMNSVIKKDTKISVIKKPLYNYFQRSNSIVRTFNKEKYIKRLEFTKTALELLKDKISAAEYSAFSFYLYEQIVSECSCAKEFRELFKTIKKENFLKTLCLFKNFKEKISVTKSFKRKIASILIYLKLFCVYRKIYLRFRQNN